MVRGGKKATFRLVGAHRLSRNRESGSRGEQENRRTGTSEMTDNWKILKKTIAPSLNVPPGAPIHPCSLAPLVRPPNQ